METPCSISLLWWELSETHLSLTAHPVGTTGSDTLLTHVQSMLIPPPPKFLLRHILPSEVAVGEEEAAVTSPKFTASGRAFRAYMGSTQPPELPVLPSLLRQAPFFPVGKGIQALRSASQESLQAVYCLFAQRIVLTLGIGKEKEKAGETGCIPIQPPKCDLIQVHQIPEMSPLDLFLPESPTSHLDLRIEGDVLACGI